MGGGMDNDGQSKFGGGYASSTVGSKKPHKSDTKPRKAASIGHSVRFRAYPIITRAVEDGIEYGYRRAHKHTDTPTEEAVRDAIYTAVMAELCDVIEFAPFEDASECMDFVENDPEDAPKSAKSTRSGGR